jgi:hypothetical protein
MPQGIRKLCDELTDLKKASAEDMRKSVFANYNFFIRFDSFPSFIFCLFSPTVCRIVLFLHLQARVAQLIIIIIIIIAA